MLLGNGQQQQDHEKSGDHAGEKGDTSHSWDGILVHFPFVGNIVELLSLTVITDYGREHKPTYQT